MEVDTTRFGRIAFANDDVFHFAEGLPGFSDCRDWMILADPASESVAWLQSVDRGDVALALVSPRRYVPEYQARVFRRSIAPLCLTPGDRVEVLAVVCRTDCSYALNLKAPVILNLDRRLGCQVVGNGSWAVRYELSDRMARRSA
jgi:flagellar assembly factor FliW